MVFSKISAACSSLQNIYSHLFTFNLIVFSNFRVFLVKKKKKNLDSQFENNFAFLTFLYHFNYEPVRKENRENNDLRSVTWVDLLSVVSKPLKFLFLQTQLKKLETYYSLRRFFVLFALSRYLSTATFRFLFFFF